MMGFFGYIAIGMIWGLIAVQRQKVVNPKAGWLSNTLVFPMNFLFWWAAIPFAAYKFLSK